MRVAEAEFAFGFAKDLPPRATAYTPEEALDAVDELLDLGVGDYPSAV